MCGGVGAEKKYIIQTTVLAGGGGGGWGAVRYCAVALLELVWC